MVETALLRVMVPVAGVTMVPKMLEPMPTTMASTISLMPDVMTLPSTRSARNAVLPNSAKGTSTKPASVVSLNSMMVMKSWTARTKNASSTMSHASISTLMVTKLLKKVVKPMSSPALSRSGRDAVKPVSATNPGRIRSWAVMVAALALRPRPAKERKIMSAREEKLLSRNAKKPT